MTLTAVVLETKGIGVCVRVQGPAAVRPTWLNLKNPSRIVLDFPNSATIASSFRTRGWVSIVSTKFIRSSFRSADRQPLS